MNGPVCPPKEIETALLTNQAIVEVVETTNTLIEDFEKFRDINSPQSSDPPISGK